MRNLRIATVPYLNVAPFMAALACRFDCHVVRRTPSRLAHLWEHGDFDLVLLSAVDLLRLRAVPLSGASISARGAVESVLVVSDRAPAHWEQITLDPASSTSNVLARLVLSRRLGLRPRFVSPDDCRGAPVADLSDAAVIIGDAALRESRSDHRLDLAEQWTDWTGHSFVFAAWTPGLQRRYSRVELTAILSRARLESVDHIERCARSHAEHTGLSPDRLTSYLANSISYRFSERERQGLRLLARMMRIESSHSVVKDTLKVAGGRIA